MSLICYAHSLIFIISVWSEVDSGRFGVMSHSTLHSPEQSSKLRLRNLDQEWSEHAETISESDFDDQSEDWSFSITKFFRVMTHMMLYVKSQDVRALSIVIS